MSWQDLRKPVIDENVRVAAEKVKAYAIEHRETMKQLAARVSANAPGPANNLNHILLVPDYRLIYSIEQQVAGWCQHISISVEKHAMSPNPDNVREILKECFGIRWNINPKRPDPNWPDEALSIWTDPRSPGVEHILFKFFFPATGL